MTGKRATRREEGEEVGQGFMRGGICQPERKIPIRSTLLMTVRRPFFWEREERVGWQSVSRREGLHRLADRRDVLRKEESRDKG